MLKIRSAARTITMRAPWRRARLCADAGGPKGRSGTACPRAGALAGQSTRYLSMGMRHVMAPTYQSINTTRSNARPQDSINQAVVTELRTHFAPWDRDLQMLLAAGNPTSGRPEVMDVGA